jgi:hypothetical protein
MSVLTCSVEVGASAAPFAPSVAMIADFSMKLRKRARSVRRQCGFCYEESCILGASVQWSSGLGGDHNRRRWSLYEIEQVWDS